MNGIAVLFLTVGAMAAVFFFITYASQQHDLNSIKDKTVGNGQHGTARWATQKEIQKDLSLCAFYSESLAQGGALREATHRQWQASASRHCAGV